MTNASSTVIDAGPGRAANPSQDQTARGWQRPEARIAARLKEFRRDESGVMIAYSIFFLLIMLIVGGIGVDFMHYEMSRTKLQNTLDRAVLAAADLQQELDPVAVVEDYLAKAGTEATLTGVPVVNSGLNYRDVTASATLRVPTQFIHMIGFDSLIAPGLAKAEQKIEAIEIALVLDISGSMSRNNKLDNLKPAAREFIDAVMDLTEAGDVAVSIIPYNSQVNAGAALLSHYNVSAEHNYSNCVDFDESDFSSASIDPSQPLKRTMHFDMYSYTVGSWPPTTADMPSPVCPTRTGSKVTVMSTDTIALKNQIDSLSAGGNTSIDIGMKWAAALLDPGTRPVIDQMIADGDVDAANTGRPLNYNARNSLKVIVVMTDGENTTQYYMPDSIRTASRSNVWLHPASGNLSIYVPEKSGFNKFFYLHTGTWNLLPYGAIDGNYATNPNIEWLTYPELFAYQSTSQNAYYNYGPAYTSLYGASGQDTAWSQWYLNLPLKVEGPAKDIRLQSICSAAKNNDVRIYSIGFEATANGNNQLRACASSQNHFFNATGVNIRDVFQAIAVSIAQLRLTQ